MLHGTQNVSRGDDTYQLLVNQISIRNGKLRFDPIHGRAMMMCRLWRSVGQMSNKCFFANQRSRPGSFRTLPIASRSASRYDRRLEASRLIDMASLLMNAQFRGSVLLLACAFGFGCGKGSDTEPSTGGTAGSAGEASSTDTGGSGGTGGSGDSGGSAGTGDGSGGSSGSPGTESSCVNSEAILEQHKIDAPSPVVSTGKTIVATSGVTNADYLVDGLFSPSQVGRFGTLESGPESVAIEVGEGPARLLLLWSDAGQSAYDNVAGGAPLGYTIETSADSEDGSDGMWETVVEVTDNGVRNRAHSFDFEGMRWVRFTATAPQSDGSVSLRELMLHDVSATGGERPEDSWLFFGDSIHQAAMQRALGMRSFENVVSEQHPDFQPIMLNASIGGEHLSDAIDRLDSVLELNPDIQYFGIAYGTNDAWGNQDPVRIGFREELVDVVESLLSAGRTPIIARIPYATAAHGTLPEFNAIIDEVQVEYELPCGPDLYTWFLENPGGLGGDGVHPNSQGNTAINAQWAAAASPLYQDP